jgi:hypothetical protein
MDAENQSPFVWRKSIGTNGTCLKATYQDPFLREIESRRDSKIKGKAKMACFDLDGCIIKPKNGKVSLNEEDSTQTFGKTFSLCDSL